MQLVLMRTEYFWGVNACHYRLGGGPFFKVEVGIATLLNGYLLFRLVSLILF